MHSRTCEASFLNYFSEPMLRLAGLRAIGYRHGMFNLEFFHDAASDRLTVIECNPRLASQFADLYRRVQGRDAHAIALALALGEDAAAVPVAEPTAGVAASLVYRTFEGQPVPPPPGPARQAAFAREFADALFFSQPKHGHGLQRDFKWTGSHRYGIVHLGGRDRADLRQRAERASALLGWPAPWAGHAAEHGADHSAAELAGEAARDALPGGSAATPGLWPAAQWRPAGTSD